MYRLFLIHPPYVMTFSSYETQVKLMSMFRAALTPSKAWASIQLPAKGLISHNCLATTASTNVIIETYSTGSSAGLWSPIQPISGVIVPIFNMPYEDHHFMMKNVVTWFSATMVRCHGYYNVPQILTIVISDPSFASLSDNFLTNWWQSPGVVPRLPHDIGSIVHIVETTDWEAIPNIVKDHFGFILDDGIPDTTIHLPSWPDIVIQLEHLGTNKEAILGFVKDCLHGFSPYDKPIQVWFASRPTYQSTQEDVLSTLSSKVIADVLQYEELILTQAKIEVPDHLIAMPGASRVVESASHVYVEYEGLVYDGIVAFQNPVPLNEYQAKLNATYQERMTITPDMNPDDAYKQIVARRNYVASLTKTS